MNTARENAKKELGFALDAEKATQDERSAALTKWEALTSGRRPGYYKAQQTVIEELKADRKPVTLGGKVPAIDPSIGLPAPVKVEDAPAEPVETAPAPAKVESVKGAPGSFLRQRRMVRRTKTVVSVYDLTHADNTFGNWVLPGTSDPAKYLVVCEDHDNRHPVKSYEAGWRAALDPATFCTACAQPAVKA